MLLGCVQGTNFSENRTTNERYSKKNFSARSAASSSVFSNTTSYMADEIINAVGAPRDFSHRRCISIRNTFEMCCKSGVPTQTEIYKRLDENKYERHRNDSIRKGGLDPVFYGEIKEEIDRKAQSVKIVK